MNIPPIDSPQAGVWMLWTVNAAGIVFIILAMMGVFTHDNPYEHSAAERDCQVELNPHTQRQVSIGDYIVFESHAEPKTYAVVEKPKPNAVNPRPQGIFCGVNPHYWEDPESWPFTNTSSRGY